MINEMNILFISGKQDHAKQESGGLRHRNDYWKGTQMPKLLRAWDIDHKCCHDKKEFAE